MFKQIISFFAFVISTVLSVTIVIMVFGLCLRVYEGWTGSYIDYLVGLFGLTLATTITYRIGNMLTD
jgi:hypothetical protein